MNNAYNFLHGRFIILLEVQKEAKNIKRALQ